jgi:hypothetical protein
MCRKRDAAGATISERTSEGLLNTVSVSRSSSYSIADPHMLFSPKKHLLDHGLHVLLWIPVEFLLLFSRLAK